MSPRATEATGLKHGDRIVRDEDFAACYSERMGRPSIPPSQLAKVLLLQHRTGASDEQAMECVAWDLRWKIALGLAVDHRGLASDVVDEVPRAVAAARARSGSRWSARCELAEELGLLDGPVEQIIDSTPMLGAAATQDTVRLVRHGVRKLHRRGRRPSMPTRPGGSIDGLEFDYARPGEKPDCRWREKAERERMLTRVAAGRRARAAGGRAAPTGCSSDEAVGEAHRLLRELIGQDFDIDDDGDPAAASRHARRVGSSRPSTPRCATAARAQQQRFDGYKLSAAATNTAEPLITAVDVAPASEQDGPQAKHLIDAQPAHRRPRAGARRHRLRHRAGARRAGRARRRGARARCPRARSSRRPAGQARLRDRSRRRHGHLPGRPARVRSAPQPSGLAAARTFAQGLCDGCQLNAIAAAPGRARSQIDPAPRRRPAHRRPPSARRSRHRRASAPHRRRAQLVQRGASRGAERAAGAWRRDRRPTRPRGRRRRA